jgi:hypothetical protein
MQVWVLEEFVCDDSVTHIQLYETEDDAAKAAALEAKDRMQSMGCDDVGNSCESWNDAYNELCKCIGARAYDAAIKIYSDWNDNLDDYSDQVDIFVFSKLVNPASKNNEKSIVDKPAAISLPKKEVPCKCCRTSLWEGESPCWKCGAENPTE